MLDIARCFICSLLVIGFVSASTVEQIWLAPANLNSNDTNILEPFNLAARGEWFFSEDAVGGRSFHGVAMDSNKTLWIVGGTVARDTAVYGVWNYNPITDKYRWVWKVGDGNDAYYPGELDVESDLNSPGELESAPTTIDLNDNIWVYSNGFELWMFNTSSWMWVRKQGLANETFSPSFGSDPGQPGTDVWPSTSYGSMLADSHGDLWLLSGQAGSFITNNVWHFNTTSNMWRFVSGDKMAEPTPSNSTYFGGFSYAGCDIDEEDKIWCYGGFDNQYNPSTLWVYDTRAHTWAHKFGSFNVTTDSIPRVTAENAFDAGNSPGGSEGGNFINRRDGTFLLVTGFGYNTAGEYGGTQDVWLYNITLNQWKHVLGNLTAIYSSGEYITRGQPGSTRPATTGFGAQSGLNFEGDVFIHGGNYDDNNFFYFKDIWLIPNDQCSSSTANKCDTNAECTEKLVGYSCQCKQGYEGDGFTCTFIPIPQAPQSANPTPSTTQSPKSATSDVTRLIASVSWIFIAALLA